MAISGDGRTARWPSPCPGPTRRKITTTDNPALSTISLIRAGATTHFFDNEQRLIDLPFTNVTGHLTLTLPTERTLAPPGWYLVFAVNNTGVPSRAAWLQLS